MENGMQTILPSCERMTFRQQTVGASASHARTSVSQENRQDLAETEADFLMKDIPTSIEETVCSNMYMVIQAPFPYDEDIDMFLKIKDFGKTVFLTKEEAKRALEERK